ncbi:putative ribonuclease H protein [Vitis vinifera]|uniref:Putative ribonuclease H protein n=1 Tax=Vitis vinifera TaxID=29760 RepID=A0A438HH88_VITVI|nr:putative ribonuclease H protein [Vitis vinifera]
MEIGWRGGVCGDAVVEILPVIRKKKGDGRDGCGRQRGEVRGEEEPRAGWRVGENLGAVPKEQRRSEDGTGKQVRNFENWAFVGRATRQRSEFAGDGSSSSSLGCDPEGQKWDYGPITQGGPVNKRMNGLQWGKKWPAEGKTSDGLELLSHGPAIKVGNGLGQTRVQKNGLDYGDSLGLKLEEEFIKCREKEANGMQQQANQLWSPLLLLLLFLSDSGEGVLRPLWGNKGGPPEGKQDGARSLRGPSVSREGCWDLIEINSDALEVQNPECTPVLMESQAQRSEKETKWEDSSLAKFSKLLGFSVEGLEREILEFLSKIRKRRERIHSKGLLEKSKFERELKSSWGSGRRSDLLGQEVFGAGGVEEGQFSISCKFRTVENGAIWVFTGVYGPFTKEDRECLWEEFGAIRGLWGEPWCVGGDFNVILSQGERSRQGRISPAMRRFAQVMNDLELVDLPLQVELYECDPEEIIPAHIDHFPITIEGGGIKRGPVPFRFENMWLKVEGFKDLLRSGWQGISVWNKEVFGNLESNKMAALQQVTIGTKWKAGGDILETALKGAVAKRRDRNTGGSWAGWFYGAFWQFCWEFVKEEILEMFKEFHEQKAFLKSLNTTFLVLIPKKEDGGAGGFRPISLVAGWLWKGAAFPGAGFRGGGQAVNISHLLFADDAIVFCEAKKDDMTFLSWILCWFEAASGLRINLAKSEIIPVGEVEEILEMAVELGCKVGKLPSTYLGLPLGAPNKAGSVWDGVEERMRWKLALWKRQYISKGGRIALIKSTLASMPLYQMSLFRMPRVVARRLEKLQRDFLWGGGSMERKAHLVNWERVCMGKEKGGLGLRKLIPLNKALLGKWVWRFANAKEEMWKRVLVAKYGQEEFGWRTKKANGFWGWGLEGGHERS